MFKESDLGKFADFAAPLIRGMANKHRLVILQILSKQDQSVNQLVDAIAIPQSVVSQHLKILLENNFVLVERIAQKRVYRFNDTDENRTLLNLVLCIYNKDKSA